MTLPSSLDLAALLGIAKGANSPLPESEELLPPALDMIAQNGSGSRFRVLESFLAAHPDGGRMLELLLHPELLDAGIQPYQTFTALELQTLPDPEYLIEDVLIEETLAEMVGDPGAMKSFLALDMAACIAAGIPWQGKRTRQGRVVYVAAEGLGGLKARTLAWEQFNGRPYPADVEFIKEAVIFGENVNRPGGTPDVERLKVTLASRASPPLLLVLDTLARMMGSGDENNTRDAGALVRAADEVRVAFGTTVQFLHHKNKLGSARGNTAIPAAMDTIFDIKRTQDVVVMECQKQKDGRDHWQMSFRPKVIELGTTPSGRVRSSVALARIDEQQQSGTELTVLDVLRDFGSAGASWTEWKTNAAERGISSGTFSRSVRGLVDEQQAVVKVNRRYHQSGGSNAG